MSTEITLIAALLLALPILAKYLLAFQLRKLLDRLKARDREVRALLAQLQALRQEALAVRQARRRVEQQHQRAQVRRSLIEERLGQLQVR
jgi:F0F1-type ATP synthase membrane subunit b/b'